MLKLLHVIFQGPDNKDDFIKGKSEASEENDEDVKSSKGRPEDKDGVDSGKLLQIFTR